jgi:hypothetical protein
MASAFFPLDEGAYIVMYPSDGGKVIELGIAVGPGEGGLAGIYVGNFCTG